ncbi:outer membrane beta-barrel protein [Hufsiella ginkgonis]|uniref:Outer membrane beta-barrel protein n=1 Tax=Hufsiella ginkgonis TaxID=2695274 RepID=A0A7K1XXY6_9SPHI|nr:outer membrane beta-barrel protein [Hufsiella ginkgonis]MXV15688.1 outer membrane beta-barrel protein [Hufsiella ginkgonis]
MKKVIILAIASLIGGASYAQSTVKFGLKGGVSLPKYQFKQVDGKDPDTKTTTNFHVTGYADAPLSSMFSIQPGISLQGKGGKYIDNNNLQAEQNTLWIEVPVNFVAKLPLGTGKGTNLFLGAGPYAGFGISGENKLTTNNAETKSDISFGDDSGDNLKGTDFGVNFLGGFQMGSGFTLGAGYGMGLTDLRPGGSGGNGKQTNRVWSFSAGFLF